MLDEVRDEARREAADEVKKIEDAGARRGRGEVEDDHLGGACSATPAST